MARISITVDEGLVEQVQRLTNPRTKREAIETALKELVQRRSIEKLIAAMGSGLVDMTPDELRQMRDSSLRRIDGQ